MCSSDGFASSVKSAWRLAQPKNVEPAVGVEDRLELAGQLGALLRARPLRKPSQIEIFAAAT